MSFHQTMHKVILIGETSVGKSSILNRYTKDTFSDLTVSTITEVFTEKNVEVKGNQMKLQIWDTAGEERYRSIVKSYFNNCVAAIIVYDITNRDTFDKAKNFWYKEIIKFNPNVSKYNKNNYF